MNKQYATTVFLFYLLVPILGLAQASEQTIYLKAKCEILEDLYVKDTNILSAAIVPAEGDFSK